jgi:hypothetical protein
MEKIYDLNIYQKQNIDDLLDILNKKGYCLDFSIPGSGKTIVCLNIIKQFEKKTLIICPRQVIHQWRNVAKILKINNIIDIVSYDLIKLNKTIYFNNNKWFLDHKTLIIFDEIHLVKNCKSKIGYLFNLLDIDKYYIYGLSGSVCRNPYLMINILKTFKMINNTEKYLFFYGYIKCNKTNHYIFKGNKQDIDNLNDLLFINPKTRIGVRTTYNDIKNLMPLQKIFFIEVDIENQIYEKLCKLIYKY